MSEDSASILAKTARGAGWVVAWRMITRAPGLLLRLQENLRVRRLRGEDMPGALACTEDMLRLAPDNAQLWWAAAVMNQRLDRVAAALKCHSRFLDLVPSGEAAARTRAGMDELRARLNLSSVIGDQTETCEISEVIRS
jgi:hypothetical protein